MVRNNVSLSFIALLAIATHITAAPAPAPAAVTVYQTDTQVDDAGSVWSQLGLAGGAAAPAETVTAVVTAPAPASTPTQAAQVAAPAAAASVPVAAAAPAAAASSAPAAAAAPASSSSTESSLDKFLTTNIPKLLSFFGISSSTPAAAPAAAAPVSSAKLSTTVATAPAPAFTFATSSSKAPTPVSSSTFSYKPTTFSTSTISSIPQPSSSGSSAIDSIPGIDATFANQILDAHNQYRADHGVAPLAWDVGPYNYALNNANNYDCSGVLTHTHGQYGENLAAGYSDGPSTVQAWYDEGSNFDYSAANTYDHFTQVIWKGSTTVGCAYKDCRAENWGLYVVCEYNPPGNVIGQEAANVLPLVSS